MRVLAIETLRDVQRLPVLYGNIRKRKPVTPEWIARQRAWLLQQGLSVTETESDTMYEFEAVRVTAGD